MSGICGWIGGKAVDAIGPMASALPRFGAIKPNSSVHQNAALHLNTPPTAGWWYEGEGLYAAIEGAPRWTDPALAALAAESGHAAALARAYRETGAGLFDRLRGAFALAVIEPARNKGLLAVDRLGIQTLCYAEPNPGLLVFGSTTDSVRRHPAVGATIRPQAIHDFLVFIDRIPAPETIYQEQRKLLPGEFLSFDGSRAELRSYWRMPYAEDGPRDRVGLAAELRQHLRAAVARCVAGERPGAVGAFLSGGLDSSTVAGLLAEAVDGRPKTFTIGFDQAGFDESAYAKIAADHFGTDHQSFYVTPEEIVGVLPTIAEIYDEPFANSSAVPTYICAVKAREAGIDLLLAGDGGDEIFAGNERYLEDSVFRPYRRLPRPLRQGLIEPLVATLPGARRIAPFRMAANYIRRANLSPAREMIDEHVFRDAGYREVFTPDFAAAIDPEGPAALVERLYAGATAGGRVKRMLHVDLQVTLADGDLRKVNRMCEAAGMRVRYPFLDDDVVEFSGRVPEDLLIEDGKLRHFYRAAVKDFLPRAIIEKSKHGFGLPFTEFAGRHRPLREAAFDCIQSLKNRGWFSRQWLDQATDGRANADFDALRGAVWDLVSLEMWLQKHVDAPAADVPRQPAYTVREPAPAAE